MPAASTLSIYDGQATPVAHNFVPLTVTPSRTVFVNRESNTSAGNLKVIAEFSPQSPTRPTDRIKISFVMPKEHLVDGVYVVSDVARYSSDFVIPATFTQAEKDDFAAYVKNTLANADIQGLIADLLPFYG